MAHGKNSVIMNLFSIENVNLFPELAVGVLCEYSVIKREFLWKQIRSLQINVGE